jgi:hypothetical protein
MGNNVSEGKPKFAVYAMMIPSVSNLLMDYIFINGSYGMEGLLGQQRFPMGFVSYTCFMVFHVE